MLENFSGIPLGGWSGGGVTPLFQQRMSEIEAFYKALTAGGGTDVAQLTGGSALRRESIETAVLEIIQRPQHFRLYNKIAKGPARSLVHEFTQQRDVGGVPGSGAVGELGPIALNTGDYKRSVVQMKLIKDRRIVTLEAEIQAENGLGSAMARETNAGALKLGTDIEYLSFYGNSARNPAEFDGFVKQLLAVGGDHVLDVRGNPLSADGREVTSSAQLIWSQGNWGQATDYFCSGPVQADINLKLNPGMRFLLNNTAQAAITGARVDGIETGFGTVMANPDAFIQESQAPYVVRGGNFVTQLTTSLTSVVSSIAGVNASNGASQFLTAHAGFYFYGVQAIGVNGDSALVVSAQVNVNAGDGVTVTVTPPAGNNAIAYRLFRSQRNGTNTASGLREIELAYIPANGDNAVTYVDVNQYIPGTSIMVISTLIEEAVKFERFLPMQRFPLAAVDNTIYTWAQVIDGALMLGKERQHRLLINILPSTATWQPF